MKRLCFLLTMPFALHAGEPVASPIVTTPTADSGWEITTAAYAPLMGIEGDIGVRGLGPFAVDSSFSDILDVMDAGFSGAVELRKGPWAIQLDAIWLKLSDSSNPRPNTAFSFEQQQLTATLAASYEFFSNDTSSVRFIAGAAYNDLELDLELVPPSPLPAISRSGSQQWVDPFIGIGFHHELHARWQLFGQLLYGGFGVASDEYWQAILGVGYRINERTTLALAYRWIAVDYEDGGFVYDTETAGPNVGLILHF
jgi:hypothetical protein